MYFNPDPKKYSQPKEKKPLSKNRKVTGELALFKEIFLKRGGRCEITGVQLIFNPSCFIHVLSKGAYPKFRLKEDNIVLADENVHHLYDCSNKEYLLSVYPKAILLYNKKDELKIEYYKKDHTI